MLVRVSEDGWEIGSGEVLDPAEETRGERSVGHDARRNCIGKTYRETAFARRMVSGEGIIIIMTLLTINGCAALAFT